MSGNMCRLWAAAAILLSASAPSHSQTKAPSDLDDDPAALLKLTQLADGYEMQLVASEPTIVNPLQINFDPQGRLWVLCAPGYPQILPGQQPRDYVVILDDIGPDGKARKVQKFAEGLTVPTGMMPGDGGVYVGQGESLLHLRDVKGTGKADEKRVVLTGFGTNDTHHTLNTFRWGPDGNLYFNQGVYIRSTAETPYGPRRHFGGGIWQLRTDRLKLEVFDRSILPNNTWGHAFDPWGVPFIASAWPGALNQVLPDSPLQQSSDGSVVPDLKMTQIGGERHCGLEIVGGRHLPDDMQGNLLTGGFLQHVIYRYALQDLETRYVAKQLPPLVQSKHRKFRPIDIRMGPDGAIYVADLYQQIIQHNQVDFRDPRRDHTRGRVWRIVRKDRPLVAIPKLVGVPAREVAAHLQDAEPWTRLHARRALAERDAAESAAAVTAWIAQLEPNDAHLQRHLLEALWTYQALDRPEPVLLAKLLRSPDPRVRGAATKVVAAWHDRLPAAVRLLAVQAADPHPRVRLEAVLSASHIPSADALPAVLVALDHPVDKLLKFALRKAAVVLQPYWRPEFQAGKLVFGGKTKHLTFALQAVKAPDALPILAKLVVDGKAPSDRLADVLQILAASDNAAHQNLAFEKAVDASAMSAEDRARVLEALEAAASPHSPTAWKESSLGSLFGHESPLLASAAIRLAGTRRLAELQPAIETIAADAKTDPLRRGAAIQALTRRQGPGAAKLLKTLAAADRPYQVRMQAVLGLADLELKQAAAEAATLLSSPPPAGADAEPLFAAFLHRKGGAEILATAFESAKPSADSARIGLRTLVGLGISPPSLIAALQKASGEESRQRKLDAAETKRLLGLVAKEGDAVRGEAVFRRSSLGCAQCHAIGGAGGIVGPDLSAIGTSAQLDYLLESILLPSKVVREGYNTAHVVTTSGRVIRGVVQRESPRELVLRDPLKDEIVIKADDIEEKKIGGSLMPDGIDRSLTDGELADLVRFLSELGKPGPFGVSYRAVARRWQILASPSPALLSLDPAALGQTLVSDATLPWTTAFSRVAGDLPLGEIVGKGESAILVRCQIDVVAAGKIGIRLEGAEGAKLWVDGTPTEVGERVSLNLAPGIRTLTFRVESARRSGATLRCELTEEPGGTGQARFPAGK